MENVSAEILKRIEKETPTFVTVTGVHGIIEAQDDQDFKKILNDSDFCVPDGMPLVWLSKLAGNYEVERVFGPDLMLRLSAFLGANNGSAFYYGGAPGVAQELADTMAQSYPGLQTAGTYYPPFRDLTDAEASSIVKTINLSGADVVWVGLSTPKQERWMSKYRPNLNVPVLLGVGAAFDYNIGRIQRAPSWMQQCGLEWLYRLIQEPRRLWKRYFRNNPLFLYYLFCEKTGLKKF